MHNCNVVQGLPARAPALPPASAGPGRLFSPQSSVLPLKDGTSSWQHAMVRRATCDSYTTESGTVVSTIQVRKGILFVLVLLTVGYGHNGTRRQNPKVPKGCTFCCEGLGFSLTVRSAFFAVVSIFQIVKFAVSGIIMKPACHG